MAPAIKSEFRKLFSIRSTLIIILLIYGLLLFATFYASGYRAAPSDYSGPTGALFLAGSILQQANLLSVGAAILALLQMTHEYRYNTIIYTLTSSSSRSKVLSSKIISILLVTALYAVFGVAIGFTGMIVGLHAAGHSLPHQDLSILTFLGKVVFLAEGFALTALLFATLLRNQIAAFVVLFVVPNTVEGLLSLLLKQHTVYLPFTALSQVVNPPVLPGAQAAHNVSSTGYLTPMKAVAVFSAYLIIGWIVTWYLFLKRDAN